MAKAKPSRTAPRKTTSTPKVNVDKDSSVSVRQIENGFIVNESGTTGKGRKKDWYNKEYYSPTNPLKGVLGGGGQKGTMRFGGKR